MLIVVHATHQGKLQQFRFDAGSLHGRQQIQVTIGRSLNAQIPLLIDDKRLSRIHLILTIVWNTGQTDAVFWIEDAGSTNGTRLNGLRLPARQQHRLYAGDHVELGDTLLTFEFAYQESQQETKPATGTWNKPVPAVPPAPARPTPAKPTPPPFSGGLPAPVPPPPPPRPVTPAAEPAPTEYAKKEADLPDWLRESVEETAEAATAPDWLFDRLEDDEYGYGTAASQDAPAIPAPGAPPPAKVPAEELFGPPQSSPAPPRQRGNFQTAPEPEPTAAPTITEVQFSAYYPRDLIPQQWQPLTAYIFQPSAARQVEADVRRVLGSLLANVRRVLRGASQPIAEGTVITATPWLDGFQFNPPQITVGFYEAWHRLDFKLRAVRAPVNQATNGRLTFTVEGVIVADLPLSVYVGESGSSGEVIAATQEVYKAIFCSYSHQDTAIVERVERAYRILGFDFLRDVHSLKSGQDWNDELYRLIDEADIFQLFWSDAAAQSDYVAREWQYALQLNRDSGNFIRPVYWDSPMPPVPDELDHIHFAYEPTLDD